MNRKTLRASITRDARIRTIYDDSLIGLMSQGSSETRRASNVEPCPGGWSADMSLVNGPVLGPFMLRQQALNAEVEWLNRNIIGARHGN